MISIDFKMDNPPHEAFKNVHKVTHSVGPACSGVLNPARAAARFAAVLPQGKVPAKDARLDGAFPKAGRTLMHCATMLPHAHGKIAAELVKVIATSTTALLAPSTGANARAFDERLCFVPARRRALCRRFARVHAAPHRRTGSERNIEQLARRHCGSRCAASAVRCVILILRNSACALRSRCCRLRRTACVECAPLHSG